VSRLQLEAQARVLVEESDAITTVLAVGVKFLNANRAANSWPPIRS